MTDLQSTDTAAPMPMRQSPKRDRHSLTAASQASLQGHLRPEHHAVVERYIIARLPALLNLGYQPEVDGATHAALMREFVGALCDFPVWALAEAMDAWVSQHNRRPSPAELRILASRAMEPITREIEDRKRAAAERADEERRTQRVSPEAAARILAENNMTAGRLDRIASGVFNRMALSLNDIDKLPESATAHWSDTAPPEDPRWDDLRRAREASSVTKLGKEPSP